MVLFYIGMLVRVVHYAIAAAGVVGAVFVASTREDAFPAADRKPKPVWLGILLGSALVVAINFPFLSWIGIVAIGVYWFDVYPQIKDLIDGRNRW